MRKVIGLACALATVLLPQRVPSFRSNVEIAVVSCAVLDANGAAVRDLTRGDFQLYDNDVRRPIKNLWVDSTMTLGVIIDASESQSDQLSEHVRSAEELLEKILHHGDRAFIVYAGEEVRLWADVTDSIATIRSRLAQAPGSLLTEACASSSGCGSSPLWDAIYNTASVKLKPLTGNKAILILTDGFDSGSVHTWNEAADAANRASAPVYAIQYPSAFGGKFAPDLYRLIGATAGSRFRAPDGDYQSILSRLQSDLRSRYVIGFTPEKLSGKIRHDVRIEVSRQGFQETFGVSIHSRMPRGSAPSAAKSIRIRAPFLNSTISRVEPSK
jgi:VWFA-related protein